MCMPVEQIKRGPACQNSNYWLKTPEGTFNSAPIPTVTYSVWVGWTKDWAFETAESI